MANRMFLVAALLLSVTAADSAELNVGCSDVYNNAISIAGEIERGDYEKVKAATRSYIDSIIREERGDLVFVLNSSGGDVEEAIKIGRLFRRTLATVYITGSQLAHESEFDAQFVLEARDKSERERCLFQYYVVYSDSKPPSDSDFRKCHSACVLMFLGGVMKRVSDNYFWIDGHRADESSDVPVTGLHRPYFDQAMFARLSPMEAESAYATLENVVREYLKEMSVTQELVDRLFKTASNEVDLVSGRVLETMIHLEEPFLKEWKIAKCGETDDGSQVLSESDFKFKEAVWNAKVKEVRRLIGSKGGSSGDYSYIYVEFVPEEFSRERYEKVMEKVRNYNREVYSCTSAAIHNHQIGLLDSL